SRPRKAGGRSGGGGSLAPPPLRGRGACEVDALLVRLLELAQQLVAAADRVVERLLRRLLAGPDALELLVLDVADLHEVAEPDPLRVLGRRLVGELEHGNVAAGVLLVEALLL